MPVTHKQAIELGLVKSLLAFLGATPNQPPEPRKPPEPDVLVSVRGQWYGIEVTQVHSDVRSPRSGSELRRAEQRYARHGKPYGLYIEPDPVDAVIASVRDKAAKSGDYVVPHGGRLWLLAACAIPGIGQTVSTHVLPNRLAAALRATVPCLERSQFERASVYAVMQDQLFEWTSSRGWRNVAAGPSVTIPGGASWEMLDRQRDDEYMRRLIKSQGTDEAAVDAEAWAAILECRASSTAAPN